MKREDPFPHVCRAAEVWWSVVAMTVALGPACGVVVGSLWRMYGGAQPLVAGVVAGTLVLLGIPSYATWVSVRGAARGDRCGDCLERRR